MAERTHCHHDDKYTIGKMRAGTYKAGEALPIEWECLFCQGATVIQADEFLARLAQWQAQRKP